MNPLTWDQVHARRLARHHLVKPVSGDPREPVRDVCGVQAQVAAAAELAIGSRVKDATRERVRAELYDGKRLVKTYSLRGTLHVHAADELALWMAAMRWKPYWRAKGGWHAYHGLTAKQGEAFVDAVREALDGECLTREELAGEVSGRVGAWARDRLASNWGELLRPVAYLGVLCFGPVRGAKVTYVRPDRWAGLKTEVGDQPDPEESAMEIVRRYLRAYGPATHQDLARWFALRPPEAREALQALGDEVARVEVEGREAYVLAADDGHWPSGPGCLRLLPQYEAYVLGSGPKEVVVPKDTAARVFEHGRGRYEGAVAHQIMLVDGVVSGMWERREKGGKVEIRLESFVELDSGRTGELEREVERVGRFYGAEATLSTGRLTGRRR
ncbi:winged helix DNA-binding domain-containing protein [Streptosporangium sp. NPDC023825]|uniref:winged helix DNA-binding domain-containing protein n=1 Tax=Streptosporangium sp. NPDC023825 TaxID=3154909 RepID=UPI0034347466